ncbi:hypothetical protein [Deinococcus hopiensis]|nr:hypothetical protein [Deinococcus hopiensis]
MNRIPVLLTLLALAAPAQALRLIVWDPELRDVLGSGETSGGRMTVQLLQGYVGPVKLVFSRDEDEKARGLYNGVQSGYNGLIKDGQLTLDTPGSDVTLTKFLSGLKLSVQVQPATQILELPGLRSAPDKNKEKEKGKPNSPKTPGGQ